MKRQGDRDSPSRFKRNRGTSFNRRQYRDNSPDYRERESRYSQRDARRNITQNRYASNRSPVRSPRYSPVVEPSRGRRSVRDLDDVYSVLLVRNFSSQLEREDIQESLEYEFQKFGPVSVRVTRDNMGERVAYATFRFPEDAKECKNAKGHLVMHDRRLSIDVAYDESQNERYSPKEKSPYGREQQYSPVRGRSPIPRSPPRRRSPKRISGRNRNSPRERFSPRDRLPYDERYSPRQRAPAKDRRMSGDNSPPRERYPAREMMSPRNNTPVRSRSPSKDRSLSKNNSQSREGQRARSAERSPAKKQNETTADSSLPPPPGPAGATMGGPGLQDPGFFPGSGFMDKNIPPEDDAYATRTLFVGNMEPDVTNHDIRRVFEEYGHIDDIDVKRAARGLGSYCFIRFSNLNEAYKAKVNLNGKAILKNVVRIGYGKVMLSSKIWVGGLGHWSTLTDLEREFDRFGAIRRVDFRRGDDSASILYETIDAAQAACNQMRGFLMPNAETRLRMDFLDPEPGMPGYEGFVEWGRHDKGFDNSGSYGQSSSDRYSGSKYSSNTNSNRYRGRNVFLDDRKDRRNRKSRSRSPRGKRSKDFKNGSRNKTSSINETASTELQMKKFHAKSCYTLHDLCQVFDPPCWQGGFVLKKIAFPVLLFMLDGDMGVFNTTTADPNSPTGRQTMFHVSQRLRLTEDNVKEVGRRMKYCEGKSCLCVAVPGVPENLNMSGTISGPMPTQHKPLRGLVKYFKEKEAAAIINVPLITSKDKDPDKEKSKEKEVSGVIHGFPPCSFTSEQLQKIGPSLQPQHFADDYLFVILVKGASSVLL